jgi:hypothetical protein
LSIITKEYDLLVSECVEEEMTKEQLKRKVELCQVLIYSGEAIRERNALRYYKHE